MTAAVRLACKPEVFIIRLDKILPMRRLDDSLRKTVKFRCIEASVRELGLIEPLVVYPQPNAGDTFMLLDGHIRLAILQSLEAAEAKCLISTDDKGLLTITRSTDSAIQAFHALEGH